ncbi:MAG: site-2 protease family protein [Candidatus Colwellbacteria bacterium]|nr:site-2 protease family protein [Candidatus Colwellbacteria bacterium]
MKKISAGSIALITKMGVKILPVLLKLAKALKFGKGALLGLSLASYAYLFTWKFAAIIVILIFVHESGHVWAMKKYGLKTKGIYFLPFIGGAAVADEEFPSRKSEAFIGIMGPIWGFALTSLVALLYFATGNPFLAATASWMALINLFNLLPINPLDGGRIMKSIAYSVSSKLGLYFLVTGIIASGFLAFKAGLMLFALLLIVAVIELAFEYKRREVLPKMNVTGIIGSSLAYLSVIALLWFTMASMSHVPGAAAAMELLKG